MAPIKLSLQVGEAGDRLDYTVDIHLAGSGGGPVQKLLLVVGDTLTKAHCLAWVNRTPDLRLQVPAPPGGLSSLVLLCYGLEADPPLQRYLVVSSGKTYLIPRVNSGALFLFDHKENQSSLLQCEGQQGFPASLDKAQSEMAGLPGEEGATCLMLCQQSRPFLESLTFRTATQGHIYNLHVSLPSRREVKVKVLVLKKQELSYSLVASSTTSTITTYLSKKDLQTLKRKALNFRATKSEKRGVILNHFYRNRWTQYFLDILSQHAGVMAPYKKDFNGDKHSAINGNIDGLFFSASPDFDTCRPPAESLFGEWRLHVPVEVMFHQATNLYFADFYCHNSAHYVTVVVTNAGSEADRFCEKRLLKLDPHHNEFLYEVGSAGSGTGGADASSSRAKPTVETVLARGFHVELFYTESINIAALMASLGQDKVFFRPCKLQGRGRSQPGGIEKSVCSICNLPD